MRHATAIAVTVCKATEGEEHLLLWLWEGIRRTHYEHIAMGESQIVSSCVCIWNLKNQILVSFLQ